MPTIGEFFRELKQVENYSGQCALALIQATTPADDWEQSQQETLTVDGAMALRKNITSRLEELRGYNESEAGFQQVEDDSRKFLVEFGILAIRFGVELPKEA